ncbi:MAG: hypothetical protein HW409_307 [candidate division NC10 bacterium]|jgi:hypothetical protein|nr:hypothetical protein [candidate division NC10 bacterium]
MLRSLVRVSLLVAVLYVGATVGFPYYQYVMMKRAVEEAADVAVARLGTMRRGPLGQSMASRELTVVVTVLMQARAIRLGLDLPAQGVQVLLEPDLLRVLANWEAEAKLPGYAQRFRFGVEGRRVVVH